MPDADFLLQLGDRNEMAGRFFHCVEDFRRHQGAADAVTVPTPLITGRMRSLT